ELDVALEVGEPPDQHPRRHAVQDVVPDTEMKAAVRKRPELGLGRRELLHPPRNRAWSGQLDARAAAHVGLLSGPCTSVDTSHLTAVRWGGDKIGRDGNRGKRVRP